MQSDLEKFKSETQGVNFNRVASSIVHNCPSGGKFARRLLILIELVKEEKFDEIEHIINSNISIEECI